MLLWQVAKHCCKTLVNSPGAKVHTNPGLPPVVKLILEVKASLVIMMWKYSIDCQTFVVKSFVMNKSEERLGLGHS